MEDDRVPIGVTTHGDMTDPRVPGVVDELNALRLKLGSRVRNVGDAQSEPGLIRNEWNIFRFRFPEDERHVGRFQLSFRRIALRQSQHIAIPRKRTRLITCRDGDEIDGLDSKHGSTIHRRDSADPGARVVG